MKPRYRITIIPDGKYFDFMFVVENWRGSDGAPINGGLLKTFPVSIHRENWKCIGYKMN